MQTNTKKEKDNCKAAEYLSPTIVVTLVTVYFHMSFLVAYLSCIWCKYYTFVTLFSTESFQMPFVVAYLSCICCKYYTFVTLAVERGGDSAQLWLRWQTRCEWSDRTILQEVMERKDGITNACSTADCCPCCPLLPIVNNFCPFLSIVARGCSLLPIVANYCPLLQIIAHCC